MTPPERLSADERRRLRSLLAEAAAARRKLAADARARWETQTPIRKVERALYLSRRGMPLRRAVREAGTTIASVREMVPGVVKTRAGWTVPFTDDLPRTIRILTAGGRRRTYEVSLREAEKYSLYLQGVKEAKADRGNAGDILRTRRMMIGQYITTTDGRKIILVYDPARLFNNLRVAEAQGWTGDLYPEED